MAVCDGFNIMRFIFISLNAPGCMHDARIYRNSSLPKMLYDIDLTVPGLYILGDGAYGNCSRILTPTTVEHTVGQSLFNFAHSSVRMTIERTFGVFKGMWKVFTLAKYNCEATGKLFAALAVVHDIIIDEKMDISEWDTIEYRDNHAADLGVDGALGGDRVPANTNEDIVDKVIGTHIRNDLIAKCHHDESWITPRVY
jgi:hypothetical protein